MVDLNPNQFFHGTTHNITGGRVLPADLANKPVSEYSFGDPGDMSEGDHAFVTADENYAWHAATTFHKNGRRPRVYETDPAPDMKPGPWHKDHPNFLEHHELDDPDDYPTVGPDSDDYPQQEMMKDLAEEARTRMHQPEYGSPTGFKIRKRIDIMPGHQGTFPSENWNKYKKDGPSYGPDANHPNDNQIKFGTYYVKDMVQKRENPSLNDQQFSGHDWHTDPPPHSELRELAGRPQKRWATLFD